MNEEFLTDEQLAERVMQVNSASVEQNNPSNPGSETTTRDTSIDKPVDNTSGSNDRYTSPNDGFNREPIKQPEQRDDRNNSSANEQKEGFNPFGFNSNEPEVEIDPLAPLKVNGRDFRVSDMRELRALAQRGVDYTKKQQALADDRRYIRALESNGLKDMDKLAFAVDLVNRKPEAISKLLRDNNIDPIDIDIDQALKYTPSKIGGDPTSERFEMVVDTIKSDTAGEDFLREFGSRINTESDTQNKLIKDPKILADLYNAKRSGLYDAVISDMDREDLYDPIARTDSFLNRFEKTANKIVARQRDIQEQALAEQRRRAEEAEAKQRSVSMYGYNPGFGQILHSGYVAPQATPRVPLATGPQGSYNKFNLNETAKRLSPHRQPVNMEEPSNKIPTNLTDQQLQELVMGTGFIR